MFWGFFFFPSLYTGMLYSCWLANDQKITKKKSLKTKKKWKWYLKKNCLSCLFKYILENSYIFFFLLYSLFSHFFFFFFLLSFCFSKFSFFSFIIYVWNVFKIFYLFVCAEIAAWFPSWRKSLLFIIQICWKRFSQRISFL